MIAQNLKNSILLFILLACFIPTGYAAAHSRTVIIPAYFNIFDLEGYLPANVDTDRKKRELLNTISQKKASAKTWLQLAEIFNLEKKFGQCIGAINNLFALDPMNLEGHRLLGEVHISRLEGEKAVNQYKKLIKLEPKSARAHYKLGVAYSLLDDVESANAEFQNAIDLDRSLSEARLGQIQLKLRSGKEKNAIYDLEKLIRQDASFIPAQFALGVIYLSKKRYEEAKDTFKGILTITPENHLVPYYLGITLKEKSDYEGALNYFERSLKLAPNYANALDQIVRIHLIKKKPLEALKRALMQSNSEPDSFEFLFILGNIYKGFNQFEKAKSAFEKSLEINPSFVNASVALTNLYISNDQYDKALNVIRRAKQNFPSENDEQSLEMLQGIAFEGKGVLSEAKKAYLKVISLNPSHASALNNLAYLYIEYLDDFDAALQFASMAHNEQPDNQSISDTLGWALYKKGQYKNALNHLKKNASEFSKIRKRFSTLAWPTTKPVKLKTPKRI